MTDGAVEALMFAQVLALAFTLTLTLAVRFEFDSLDHAHSHSMRSKETSKYQDRRSDVGVFHVDILRMLRAERATNLNRGLEGKVHRITQY